MLIVKIVLQLVRAKLTDEQKEEDQKMVHDWLINLNCNGYK